VPDNVEISGNLVAKAKNIKCWRCYVLYEGKNKVYSADRKTSVSCIASAPALQIFIKSKKKGALPKHNSSHLSPTPIL